MNHLPKDDHQPARDDNWYFGIDTVSVPSRPPVETADRSIWLGCVTAILMGVVILLFVGAGTWTGTNTGGRPFTVSNGTS